MLREIHISPVLNGFIVQAGCQKLAYTSIDKLILDLGAYFRDPEKTEKRILKEEGINRKYTLADQPVVDTCCNQQATAGGPIGIFGGNVRSQNPCTEIDMSEAVPAPVPF